jgi:2-C-methyl-D-erythritol 4-phosphate cytidylyltransferase
MQAAAPLPAAILKSCTMNAYAIIPAAGLSTRMGSTTGGTARKQLIEVGGAPLLIHTLRRFNRAPHVEEILVPVRPEDRQRVSEQIEQEHFEKRVRVLDGGATRQESVWNALQLVPAAVPLIAVHDAVRPFIDVEIIERAIEAAGKHGAVIVGVPAIDTIKQVERTTGDANRVVGTLPRERIVLAQTPQVFRHDLLRRAFERAIEEGYYGTDDAALIEHLGVDVFVIQGSPRNWKITTPTDLEAAEVLLARKQGAGEGVH